MRRDEQIRQRSTATKFSLDTNNIKIYMVTNSLKSDDFSVGIKGGDN
jgi:hypothetical protein